MQEDRQNMTNPLPKHECDCCWRSGASPRSFSSLGVHLRLPLSSALIWFGTVILGCGACATSPRSEAANSAAASSPAPIQDTKTAKESALAPPPPESAPEPPQTQQSPAMAHHPAFASPAAQQPALPTRRSRRAEAEKSAPSPAAGQAAPANDESVAPRDMLQEALQPEPSDTPILRQALQDLLNAAQTLSTSHSCEEGCKAYESMQRAANRICDLDTPRGPDRCAAARTKVSSADQEIRRRCGSCSK
jgi:hypothetical protein